MGRCRCCGCRDKLFVLVDDWDSITPAQTPGTVATIDNGTVLRGTFPIRDAGEVLVQSFNLHGTLDVWIHYDVDTDGVTPLAGTGIQFTITGALNGGGIFYGGKTLYFAPTWHQVRDGFGSTYNADAGQPTPNGRIQITATVSTPGDLDVRFIDGTRVFNADGTPNAAKTCTGRGVLISYDDADYTDANALARFTGSAQSPACFGAFVFPSTTAPAYLGSNNSSLLFIPPFARPSIQTNAGGLAAFQTILVTDSGDGFGCNQVHVGTLQILGTIPAETLADPYPRPSFDLTIFARTYNQSGPAFDQTASQTWSIGNTPSPSGAFGLNTPGGVLMQWTF